MKLADLNEVDNRVRFSVYNYGADQTLFSDRATSPEAAVEKARVGLADYGYDSSKLENVVIKDDGEYGKLIMFPDAKISIGFKEK